MMTALVAMLALAVPGGAHAETRQVSLTGNRFVPAVRSAVAGDAIRLDWVDQGVVHNVQAYMGDSFVTGDGLAPREFTFDFGGDVVRYRCLRHSTLENGFRCNGMCGAVADHDLDVIAPEAKISSPENGAIVTTTPSFGPAGFYNPVTISGTATDDRAVYGLLLRLYDTTGRATEYEVSCTGCLTPSATWTTTRHLMPGSYVAEILVADTFGNTPRIAPRVSFIVL